jgi:hypothetical protein
MLCFLSNTNTLFFCEVDGFAGAVVDGLRDVVVDGFGGVAVDGFIDVEVVEFVEGKGVGRLAADGAVG